MQLMGSATSKLFLVQAGSHFKHVREPHYYHAWFGADDLSNDLGDVRKPTDVLWGMVVLGHLFNILLLFIHIPGTTFPTVLR